MANGMQQMGCERAAFSCFCTLCQRVRLTSGIEHKFRCGVYGPTAHGDLDGVKLSGGQVCEQVLSGKIVSGQHLVMLQKTAV